MGGVFLRGALLGLQLSSKADYAVEVCESCKVQLFCQFIYLDFGNAKVLEGLKSMRIKNGASIAEEYSDKSGFMTNTIKVVY